MKKIVVLKNLITLVVIITTFSSCTSKACSCYEEIKSQTNTNGFYNESCMHRIPEINEYIEKNQRYYQSLSMDQRKNALLGVLRKECN